MNTILFISHEASLTGAPILLLNFLKWFKANSSYPFIILIRKDGPLKDEFARLAPVYIFKNYFQTKNGLRHKLKSKLNHFFNYKSNQLRKDLEKHNIGLVFSNTLTNGDIIKCIGLENTRMITYAHELGFVIENVPGVKSNLSTVLERTSFFLNGSEAVRQNLINNYGVSIDKTEVVYSYLPSVDFKKDCNNSQLRKSLNIPDDVFIIGGIGRGLWRKGIDVFLNVAHYIVTELKRKDIFFMWVGMEAGDELNMIRYDLERLNLNEKVYLIPPDKDIKNYLNIFDVFLLTSREDPFPVVVIEAASMEVPIICFENSGGSPEFIGNDAGFCVPYLSIKEMAEKSLLLIDTPELKRLITKNAAAKVRAFHDLEYAGPIIEKCIQRYMKVT